MRFTFRDLQVFLAVMTTGSATNAANELGMTQPNVSKTIKRMEHRIGVPLFQRMRGRLRPTPEAELLLVQAHHLQGEIDTFSKYAARIQSQGTGVLRICALPLFSNRLIPDAIAHFVSLHPGVEVRLEINHDQKVIESVSRGHADFGLVHFAQADAGEDIRLDVIGNSPMGCAVHRNHPLATLDTVASTDLIGERIISYPEFLPFRKAIDLALGDHSADLQPDIVVNHSSLVCELVSRNVGIAFLDPLSVPYNTREIRLIKFQNCPSVLVGLLSQPAIPHSALATEFRSILENTIASVLETAML